MTTNSQQAVTEANRIWFDTEFIEDGKAIELVSIGLVRMDGATYYAEVAGVDYSRADPWLHANVFPHLQGGEYVKPREQIASEIIAFAGSKPEFWAYYADYDWVALCQLHGRMIDLPDGWPMFCRDLKQMAEGIALPKQEGAEHHALADALWTKLAFEAALSAQAQAKPVEVADGFAGIPAPADFFRELQAYFERYPTEASEHLGHLSRRLHALALAQSAQEPKP